MTHEEIKILISAYIDGEVTPSEKNVVEEHLSTCVSCQKDYKMYMAMSSSLSKWSDETLSPDEEIKVQRSFQQRREPMFTKRTILTIGTTLAVFIIIGSTQQFLKRGLQGRLKGAVDNIGDQYSSGNSNQVMVSIPSKVENKNVLPSNPTIIKPILPPVNPLPSSFSTGASLYRAASTLAAEPFYINRTAMNPLVRGGGMNLATNNLETTMAQSASSIAGNTPPITDRLAIGRQLTSFQSRANPAYEPYYLSSNYPQYNYPQYNYPNYNGYYPQPYPVEPYRIQNAASNTEQYDRIYDNPFLTTKENPLSTFSIDVDTGSYSNIRRFLLNSQKPPKDAVNIEELINYFSYNYPQPTGEDPFSITTEISPCPWNPQHQIALIGLQGKKIPMENLPASNLVFLIDVSGSMRNENKLPLLKSSLHLLVEQLRPQDTVSIAVFSGSAARLLEPTSGRDKDKILNAIDNLEANGSTNGEEGLHLAYEMAKESFIPHGNNRIIITTDGDFNVGTSNDGDLVRIIEEKRDQGVYLSVFGFGMGNLKASRMEKLADSGHGNYDYIDSLNEARKQFEQQLTGTLYGIAKDVKIQVEFNPSTVKAYRLIGYEKKMLNKEDFNNDKKDAGVLGSGHTVTALYEITPAESKESFGNVDDLRYQKSTVNPSNDLMTVKLRYKDPQSETSKLITRTLNRSQFSQEPSENLRFAGAVAEFGMLLRDSEYKGSSSYLQVMDTAQKAVGADVNGYRKDFLDLIGKAGLLPQSSNNTPPIENPSIENPSSGVNYSFYNFNYHGFQKQTVTLPGLVVPGQTYHLQMVSGRDTSDNHCSQEWHNGVYEIICDPNIIENDYRTLHIQVGDQNAPGAGLYDWRILDQNYNPVFEWVGYVDYNMDVVFFNNVNTPVDLRNGV
jgi:Ca-activated chloride channel homolog